MVGGTHFPLSPPWSPDFEIVGGKFGGDIPPMVWGIFFVIPPHFLPKFEILSPPTWGGHQNRARPLHGGGDTMSFWTVPPTLHVGFGPKFGASPPWWGAHNFVSPPTSGGSGGDTDPSGGDRQISMWKVRGTLLAMGGTEKKSVPPMVGGK